MFMNLEGVNGNRHFEILTEGKDLKEKFYRVEKDVNKVEVVTDKNCIEIEYLKAVKQLLQECLKQLELYKNRVLEHSVFIMPKLIKDIFQCSFVLRNKGLKERIGIMRAC